MSFETYFRIILPQTCVASRNYVDGFPLTVNTEANGDLALLA